MIIKDGRFRMVPAPIPIPPWHSDSDSDSDSTLKYLHGSISGSDSSYSNFDSGSDSKNDVGHRQMENIIHPSRAMCFPSFLRFQLLQNGLKNMP